MNCTQKPLITTPELARMLGFSTARVIRLAQNRWIPGATRVGSRILFKRAVLEQWLETTDETDSPNET
jgi:excisionase family DNA binding protein